MRNSFLHQKLTFFETLIGYILYVGYHTDSNGAFSVDASLDLLSILDDAERNRVGTQKSIEVIRAEPERFLPLALNRLVIFYLEKRALVYFYSNVISGYCFECFVADFCIRLRVCCVSPDFDPSVWKNDLGASDVCCLHPAMSAHPFLRSFSPYTCAIFFCYTRRPNMDKQTAILREQMDESAMGKVVVSLVVLAVLLLFLNWGFELSRDADKIVALFGPTGNLLYYPY